MIEQALTILGSAAIGGIILAVLNRWWKTRDDKSVAHITTEGKEIDLKSDTIENLFKRVAKLEERVEELNDKLSVEMQKSARLEAQNEALKKENEDQKREILSLRQRLHDLSSELNEMKLRMLADEAKNQAWQDAEQDRREQ